jgi:hypothetical protein
MGSMQDVEKELFKQTWCWMCIKLPLKFHISAYNDL